MVKKPLADTEASRKEYLALPDSEWRKDYFDEMTGGFVATHILKEKDNYRRPGIVAEVNACYNLARIGKQVLRLPENIPNLIDTILIGGKPYRELLKFKTGEKDPRGYPDAYFDGQTWDFKTSSFEKIDTTRQLIKNARKADNVVFVISQEHHLETIGIAIDREFGNRLLKGGWEELPDVYCLRNNQLSTIWVKKK